MGKDTENWCKKTMESALLGKVVKAMYKLSGKTLNQLSEETELTVDTINNVFYARLLKPGYFGVAAFVKATGYTMADLEGFMNYAKELPEDADITEEFTKYIFSVKEPVATVDSTVAAELAPHRPQDDIMTYETYCLEIKKLNEQHEKQLDRFRATHLHYVDQINERYQEQIGQMDESYRRLKEHYDHSVGEIKKSHAEELERQTEEINSLKKMIHRMIPVLIAESVAVILLAVIMFIG